MKEELEAIKPKLEEMKRRKGERMNQFAAVVDQIQTFSKELCLHFQENAQMSVIDENDLSVRRLEEMQNYLLALQKEKVFSVSSLYLLQTLHVLAHDCCLE